MAAPSFRGAGTGVPDAGGAWTYSCPIYPVSGLIFIVQILQDGATNGAVAVTGSSYINKLDGTSGWTQIPGPNADGSFPVGGSSEARQFLYIGRSINTTYQPTISGTNSTSEDLFIRSYTFNDVNTGTTLEEVIENGDSVVRSWSGSETAMGAVRGDGGPQFERSAESFTVPQNVTVDRVSIKVNVVNGSGLSGTVTAEIQTDSGGLPSGTVVGSGATVNASLFTAGSIVDFDISASLTSGTTYWLVIRASQAYSGTNYALLSGTSLNTFSGTKATRDSGVWSTTTGDIWFNLRGTPPTPIITNSVGTSATASDASVQTAGSDRLPLNFIAVNDDNAISGFTGETGGNWMLAVTPYADAGGTDGAIGLTVGQRLGSPRYEGTSSVFAINGPTGGQESIAQSFASPGACTLANVWVPLNKINTPAQTLTVEIQTDSGGVPSGTVVGTSISVDETSLPADGWRAWAVAAPLSASTTYWIVIRRSARDGTNFMGWYASATAGYAGGVKAQRNSGSWVTDSGFDCAFVCETNLGGTIDGGSGSIVDIDAWGVVGFALKPVPPSGPTTYYGVTATPLTFNKAVAGRKETFGQTSTALTFTKAVAGVRKALGQVAAIFTFSKAVAGVRTALGQTATPLTFSKSVAGTKTTFGQIVEAFTVGITTAGNRLATTFYGIVAAPFTFTKNVLGQRKTFGQTVSSYTFFKDVRGFKETFAQIAEQFTFNKVVSATRTTFSSTATSITATIATAGYRVGNTLYGIVAAPFTFTKSIIGQRKTFGQTASSYIFSKDVRGFKETFAQLVAPFTLTKIVSGVRTTFSSTVTSFTVTIVTAGYRSATTLYGIVSAPFIFTKSIIGQRKTFGQTTIPVIFNKAVIGQRKTFSQIAAPFTFTKSILGKKTTFAQIDTPVTFYKEVAGRKQTFAQVAFPLDLSFSVIAEFQGVRFGSTSMSLVFEEQTSAQRETFSQITSPYLFMPAVQGERTTFGRFDRPFIFSKSVIGQRKTFGQLAFPINVNVAVSGRRMVLGNVAMGLIFGEQTAGQRKVFGRILSPYLLATTTQAERTTFGHIETDIDFLVDVNTGRVEAFSALAFEILIGLEAAGFVRPNGIILNLAKEIYLGATPVESIYTEGQKVWPPSS